MKEDQKELYDVVVDYTYALDTLDDYDYQRLGIRNTTKHGALEGKTQTQMAEGQVSGTLFILVNPVSEQYRYD